MQFSVLILCAQFVFSVLSPSQQSPPAGSGKPAFEVASVKPNKSGEASGNLGFGAGGRLTATNATVRDLIKAAYASPQPLFDFQLVGGPSWMNSERFDITTRAEGQPQFAQLMLMLRTLLENRFKLKAHRETRELPIYALVPSNADGRLGPRLRRAADCSAPDAPKLPAVPGQPAPCRIDRGFGRSTGRGVPLTLFVTGGLSSIVGRSVIDRTALTGFFDWDLEWAPVPGEPSPPRTDSPIAPVPNDGPSIFTALKEQLGLMLESEKGPVEVVVIDSVERPTPD
jgi:uncharacterized protein (TIGR03435 family)